MLAAPAFFRQRQALLHAEAVKDREGAVRSDRAKLEHDDRWIYDNFQRGFEEAKRTGKPLLVVLRWPKSGWVLGPLMVLLLARSIGPICQA